MVPEKKLIILIAAHIGYPRGGMSVNYENLLESILKDRVDLHFVETADGRSTFDRGGKVRLENFRTAYSHILRFAINIGKVKPQVVHIGTARGLSFAKHSLMVFFARLYGVKVVLTPHCGLGILIPGKASLWRSYVLFTLRQCTGLAVLSREWLQLSSLLPGCLVTYIPNALELTQYTQLLRPRPENNSPDVKILFLGHIGKEKGVFDLVDALRLLHFRTSKKFQASIVGDALEPGEVEQVSAVISSYQLQDIIKVYPPEYGERKLERIQSADIFVLPSYTEGMPISLIEALAAGLPVVASCVGGIPDMITQRQEGILISPGDTEELARALLELIENPSLRLEMGEKGRKKAVSQYSMDVKAQNLISLYQKVAA